MIPIGQSQAIWKCKWPGDQVWIKYKWRHLMTKFGSNGSGATWRLHFNLCKWLLLVTKFWVIDTNFRILTKFQDFDQVSGFWPNFRILTNLQDFDQISGLWLNFRNLSKFQDFNQISGFLPNFRIWTNFQDLDQFSGF